MSLLHDTLIFEKLEKGSETPFDEPRGIRIYNRNNEYEMEISFYETSEWGDYFCTPIFVETTIAEILSKLSVYINTQRQRTLIYNNAKETPDFYWKHWVMDNRAEDFYGITNDFTDNFFIIHEDEI